MSVFGIKSINHQVLISPRLLPLTEYCERESDREELTKHANQYEQNRIRELANQREIIQKKTFTRWINVQIENSNYKIIDLFQDLRDGRVLILLLENLSGVEIGFSSFGKMRIHSLENVEKAINFLINSNVHMENIGSHDIVDGNPRITLGLVWTIILRFHIQEITFIDSQTCNQGPLQSSKSDYRSTDSRRRYSKDALLLWCKVKTANYPNLSINNFSSSWINGLGFNALIHRYCPKLLDFSRLNPDNHLENLENAFSLAERYFNIPRYFDPEDLIRDPDERSIITYLSAYYHCFNQRKLESVNAKKIGKLLDNIIACFHLITNYEIRAEELVEWVYGILENLNRKNFAKDSIGLQQQLIALKNYILFDKSTRFIDQGNLEIDLFEIRSKLLVMNLKIYQPPPLLRTSAINKLWSDLEIVENKREQILRDEILRVQRLDQLSKKFFKKSNLRENWIKENRQYLVNNKSNSVTLDSVYGALHRQQAFENDVFAYSDRISNLTVIANELDRGRFHKIDQVFERLREIDNSWNDMIDEIQQRRKFLESRSEAVTEFGGVEVLMKWMEEIEIKLRGKLNEKRQIKSHGIEGELQIHEIIETDIRAIYEVIRSKMNRPSSEECLKGALQEKQDETLRVAYTNLVDLANERRSQLDKVNVNYQISVELNETRNWLVYCHKVLDELVNNFDTESLKPSQRRLTVLENDLNSEGSRLKNLLSESKVPISEDNTVLIERTREERMKVFNKLAIVKHRYDLIALVICYSKELDDWENWICQRSDLLSTWLQMKNTKMIYKTKEELVKFRMETQPELAHRGIALKTKVDQEFLTIKSFFDNIKESNLDVEEADRMKNQLYQLVNERNVNIDNLLKTLESLLQENLVDLEKNKSLDSLKENLTVLSDYVEMKRKQLEELMKQVPDIRDYHSLESEEFSRIFETVSEYDLRIEALEQDLNRTSQDVASINETMGKLEKTQKEEIKSILPLLLTLNDNWNGLADKIENDRYYIKRQLQLLNLAVELVHAEEWVMEKIVVIKKTDQIDIVTHGGTMHLQRSLTNIRRDITALESRITDLHMRLKNILESLIDVDSETRRIYSIWLTHLYDQLMASWSSLGECLELRCQRLCQGGLDQNYSERLATFKEFIDRLMREVTSDSEAIDLAEAERKLMHQKQCRKEIDSHTEEADLLIREGLKITSNSLDPYHIMLTQSIREMEESWQAIQRISSAIQDKLQERLYFFVYQKTNAHIDVLLSQQESSLSTITQPENSYTVQDNMMKLTNVKKSLENISSRLTSHNQQGTSMAKMFPQNLKMISMMQQKSDHLREKFTRIEGDTLRKERELKDKLIYHEFLDQVDEFLNWIQEKEEYISRIKTFPTDRKNNAFFHVFEELTMSENTLELIFKNGRKVSDKYPHLEESLANKAEELQVAWKRLMQQLQSEKDNFIDENREDQLRKQTYKLTKLYENVKIYSSIAFLCEEDEQAKKMSLIELKKIADKIKHYEDSFNTVFRYTLTETLDNVAKLKVKYPMKEFEYDKVIKELEAKRDSYQELLHDLKTKYEIERSYSKHFLDLSLERYWADEKMSMLSLLKRDNYKIANETIDSTTERVSNFSRSIEHNKNTLKSNCGEIDNRRPRVNILLKTSREFIKDNSEKMSAEKRDLFEEQVRELEQIWDKKIESILTELHDELHEDTAIHNFIQEANEIECWIYEKHLMVLVHEGPGDEEATLLHRRKNASLQQTIVDYETVVSLLDRKYNEILTMNQGKENEGMNAVKLWNERVQNQYRNLVEQVSNNAKMLDLRNELFQVMLELEDVEIWLVACHKKAASNEIGIDLEQCNNVYERFRIFSEQVASTGEVKIKKVLEKCDILILNEHPESNDLAICKERIDDLWMELQEMTKTRMEMLKLARDLHSFLAHCDDFEERITERRKQLPEVPPEKSIIDASQLDKTQRLHYVLRKYSTVLKDLDVLSVEMDNLNETATKLLPLYSDKKLHDLSKRFKITTGIWKDFLAEVKEKRRILNEYTEFDKFFIMAREHIDWMEAKKNDMENQVKPKDINGVNCIIDDHRTLLYEIKSKNELIDQCLDLGRQLLPKENTNRKDRIGIRADVRERCIQLATGKLLLNELWRERWDRLQILHEIRLFAKDSDEADAWLNSIEIKLALSRNKFGQDISETLSLLGAHYALERSMKSAQERFDNLKKLTAIELRSMEWKNSDLIQRENDKRAKIRAVMQEFLEIKPSVHVSDVKEDVANIQESPKIRKPLRSIKNIQDSLVSIGSRSSQKSSSLNKGYDSPREPLKVVTSGMLDHVLSDSPISHTASVTLPHSEPLAGENSDEDNLIKATPESFSISKRSNENMEKAGDPDHEERKPRTKRRSKMTDSSISENSNKEEKEEDIIKSLSSSPLTDYTKATSKNTRSESVPAPTKRISIVDKKETEIIDPTETNCQRLKLEGPIARKQITEKGGSKRSRSRGRGWNSLYLSLDGVTLRFYKDQKTRRERQHETFRNEHAIILINAKASVATDYVKRPSVFKLIISDGTVYLLQAASDVVMNRWISAINEASESADKDQILSQIDQKSNLPIRGSGSMRDLKSPSLSLGQASRQSLRRIFKK